MFDVYIQSQKVNPARRLLLLGALVTSISATVAGLAFLWVAGKMNISRVDPPTIEFMMVQLTEEEPPPPPPPPPPPAESLRISKGVFVLLALAFMAAGAAIALALVGL